MERRKRRRRTVAAVAAEPAAVAVSSSAPYEVLLTESAEKVYVDLYSRAKAAEEKNDPTNAACTTFRMVSETIKNVIPKDPINKRYALTEGLSNIFRIKKGRLRICWIASSKLRKIYVLFISETMRKAGDANDPYRIFEKILMSGELDEFFAKLGVKKPERSPIVQ